MGKKESFFSRFFNLFKSDTKIVQNTESERKTPDEVFEDKPQKYPDEQIIENNKSENDLPADTAEEVTDNNESESKSPDDISEDKSQECLSEIIEEAKIAAALPTNLVKNGNQSYLIISVHQDVEGKTDKQPLNLTRLSFHTRKEKERGAGAFFINCYLPLYQKELVPGVYHFNENPSSMSMNGYIYFNWFENRIHHKKRIKIVAGALDVKKNVESYLITGDFKTEDNESATIHYEGNLRLRKWAILPNGKGLLEYDGKTYPFNTLYESNRGMRSKRIIDYDSVADSYWRNNIEIDLGAEEETKELKYNIILTVSTKDSEKVLPGKYRCFEENFRPVAGTFTGYIKFTKKEDNTGTEIRITDGTLIIERNEYLIFSGELTLEDGRPITISYKGKPEWHDYS